MTMPVTSFYYIDKIEKIIKCLKDNQFDGFPIRNSNKQCIGLISRHHLMVILDNIDVIIQKSERDGKKTKQNQSSDYNPLQSSINSGRTEDTNQSNPILKNRNSLGSEDGTEDEGGKRVSPEKGTDHSDTSESSRDSEIIG